MHGEREPSKYELQRADEARAWLAVQRALSRQPSLFRVLWWWLTGKRW